MTFQGAALPGGAANGNPLQPYSESGDTITPADCESAIFDAAEVPYAFPGDSTSWFGFAAGNTITPTGAYPVSLDNAMERPSSIGGGNVDFTVTGFFDGGGMVSPTFIGLAAAATETMGFTNLDSLQFAGTSDEGIDNIELARSRTRVALAACRRICGSCGDLSATPPRVRLILDDSPPARSCLGGGAHFHKFSPPVFAFRCIIPVSDPA